MHLYNSLPRVLASSAYARRAVTSCARAVACAMHARIRANERERARVRVREERGHEQEAARGRQAPFPRPRTATRRRAGARPQPSPRAGRCRLRSTSQAQRRPVLWWSPLREGEYALCVRTRRIRLEQSRMKLHSTEVRGAGGRAHRSLLRRRGGAPRGQAPAAPSCSRPQT